MLEIKAPNKFDFSKPSLFLSGSIEMGRAINWQNEVIKALKEKDIIIYNPRRDDWDSSWVQDISNNNFREQVEWELIALSRSDFVIINFVPDTKSPITLLELGLCNNRKNVFVCCPDGFWRRGNVEIVCIKYSIPFFNDMKNLLKEFKQQLTLIK